jgi:predicted transcriptional regulator
LHTRTIVFVVAILLFLAVLLNFNVQSCQTIFGAEHNGVTIMTTTTLTNTGLDQLTNIILSDTGLAGNKRVLATDIQTGATSANGMNALIIEAIKATSTANDGKFTAADIRDISDYIKTHYATEWTALHGDDETGVETGFHLVQNDGATTTLYDKNAVNTVADSIYHLGFGYKNNNLINEDGNNNANLTTVATWLNSLLATDLTTTSLASQTIDLSTTGTGLDQLTDLIIADEGLNQRISTTEIRAGATAANGMNALIIEAIKATGVANDATLTGADVRDINAYLRANHLTTWTALHGNDEDNQPETGFHLVQNDGATTKLYDKNAVNTVADGIYHLAFEVKNNNLLNEDGNANANVNTVATWLTSLLATDLAAGSLSSGTTTDLSTTGTGLDQLTDLIMVDAGLNSKISTTEIKAGATAANSMNKLIIEGIKAMGVANDGTISTVDVREVNSYLRVNHAAEWLVLHGDDEDGVETGFHLVQNDGATTKLYDKNAVNTVADGIYHLGFTIDSNRLLNEDGNKNAAVSDVATWLNSLLATDIANGSLNGTTLVGQSAIVTTVAIA